MRRPTSALSKALADLHNCSPVFRFCIACCLLLLAGKAEAGIFSWTDDAGHVHYSDTPVEGAKRVGSGSVNTTNIPRSIPFKRAGGGVMIVEGRVADVPILFVVDTGASVVAIPPSIAQRAGVSTAGASMVPMHTANGTVNVPLVEVSEITAGDVRRDHVRAVVQEVVAGKPVGLLGMSFLGNYRVTVDHEHSLLVLEPR